MRGWERGRNSSKALIKHTSAKYKSTPANTLQEWCFLNSSGRASQVFSNPSAPVECVTGVTVPFCVYTTFHFLFISLFSCSRVFACTFTSTHTQSRVLSLTFTWWITTGPSEDPSWSLVFSKTFIHKRVYVLLQPLQIVDCVLFFHAIILSSTDLCEIDIICFQDKIHNML